jgi:hypothetical protein
LTNTSIPVYNIISIKKEGRRWSSGNYSSKTPGGDETAGEHGKNVSNVQNKGNKHIEFADSMLYKELANGARVLPFCLIRYPVRKYEFLCVYPAIGGPIT